MTTGLFAHHEQTLRSAPALRSLYSYKQEGLYYADSLPWCDGAHFAQCALVFMGYCNTTRLPASWRSESEAHSEVAAHLLRGYLKEGQEFLKRIDGAFSLVLLDSRSNTLIAARDILGQQPLFYWKSKDGIVVSPSIRGILDHTTASSKVHYGALAEYMLSCQRSEVDSAIASIKKVPPAHYLVHQNGTLNLIRYWEPDFELSSLSPVQASEAFSGLLLESFRQTLPALDAIAVSFSGGLDSSALAAFAKASRKSKLFTMRFAEGPGCEVEYSDSVASFLKLPQTEIPPKAIHPEWLRRQVVRSCDFPSEPNAYLLSQVRKAACAEGIFSLWTGYGGDELLSGYEQKEASASSGMWQRLKHCLPLVPQAKRLFPALRWYPSYFRPSFFKDSGIEGRMQEQWMQLHGMQAHQRAAWTMLAQPYASHIRECEQREAMFDGSLLVHPFLNRAVVEFLLSLPQTYLYAGQTRKVLLRDACKGMLPKTLLERSSKAEFSFVWREALEETSAEQHFPRLTELGWIDEKILKAALKRCLGNRAQPSADLEQMWCILGAEHLLEATN